MNRTAALVCLLVGIVALGMALSANARGVAGDGPDRVYQGSSYNWVDNLLYQYWSRQVRDGTLRPRLPYTADPAATTRMPVLYPIVVGTVSRLTGLSFPHTQLLLQAVAGALLLLVLAWFVSWCLRDPPVAAFAFAALAIGSGGGWLATALGVSASTLDLRDESQNIFFTLSTFPHQALCAALYVGCVWAVLAGKERRWPPALAILAGVLAAGAGLVHPYHYPEQAALVAILCLHAAWRQRDRAPVLFAAAFALTVLPHVLFTGQLLLTDPFLLQFRDSVKEAAPPVVELVFSYGIWALLWPVACVAYRSLPDRARPHLVWAAVLIALASNAAGDPRSQHHLNLLQVPLVVAAAGLIASLPKRRRGLAMGAALALSIPSTLLVLRMEHELLAVKSRVYYTASSWIDAMGQIERLSPRANVLASFRASLLLPIYTRLEPVIGHPHWTPRYKERLRDVELFFSGARPAERAAVLKRYDIAFVFVDPELSGATGYRPEADPLLERAFSAGEISVYKPRR